jgi:hypothetical protein
MLRYRVDSAAETKSIEWHQNIKLFPDRWVCACRSTACQCDLQAQLAAVEDASPIMLSGWIGQWIDGVHAAFHFKEMPTTAASGPPSSEEKKHRTMA